MGIILIGVGASSLGSSNHAPEARARIFRISDGKPLFVDLLAYASDRDGNPLTISIIRQPEHGVLVEQVPGEAWMYTPTETFLEDRFRYLVSDGSLTDSAEVLVLGSAGVIVVRPDVDAAGFLDVSGGATAQVSPGEGVVATAPGGAADSDGRWNVLEDLAVEGSGLAVLTSSTQTEDAPQLAVTVADLGVGTQYSVYGRFVTNTSLTTVNGIEMGLAGGSLELLDLRTPAVTIRAAGEWEEREVLLGTVLSDGTCTVVVDDAPGQVTGAASWAGLLLVDSSVEPEQHPYGGVAPVIRNGERVVLEAEDFDEGGNGVAYYDATAGNEGPSEYRPSEDVDIGPSPSGGYVVGWTRPGEWLEFTVDVESNLDARIWLTYSNGTADGAVASVGLVAEDGSVIDLATFSLAQTSSWGAFSSAEQAGVFLPQGASRVLRITTTSGFFNLDRIEVEGVVQEPFLGVPTTLGSDALAIVQAEDYDVGGNGVAYFDTSAGNTGPATYRLGDDVDIGLDLAGEHFVGWVEPGEWLEYSVNVPAAYQADIMLAYANGTSEAAQAALELLTPEGRVTSLGTFSLSPTSDWFSFSASILGGVSIPAGDAQILRLVVENGHFNVDRIEVVATDGVGGGAQEPFHALPFTLHSDGSAVIEVEDFDIGDSGVAYFDTTPGNTGPAEYRPGTDVDLGTLDGGGHFVGWVEMGEWLEYTVDVPAAYEAQLRLTYSNGTLENAHAALALARPDGSLVELASFVLSPTDAWDAYAVAVQPAVAVPQGSNQVLRISIDSGNANLDSLEIVASVGSDVQVPHLGGPFLVGGETPVVVEAEEFDDGGNGIAYLDTTGGNTGPSTYRVTEDVDLGYAPAGGSFVGWVEDGEWLEYTLDVPYPMYADINLVYANGTTEAAAVSLELEAVGSAFQPLATFTLPPTAAWDSYSTSVQPAVSLPEGLAQVLRVRVVSGYFNLDRIEITEVGTGVATQLDDNRRAALWRMYDAYSLGAEDGSLPTPNRTLVDVSPASEADYWQVILALLGLHDLGELDATAVEAARQLIRYQLWANPGPCGGAPNTCGELGFNNPPFRLGVRVAAMRTYGLYHDVLFPDGDTANADIEDIFRMRVESQAGLPPMTGGTENHNSTNNAYRLIASELVGATGDSNYTALADWWRSYARHMVEKGLEEWGARMYSMWTLESALLVAELSQDQSVRDAATMAVDFNLALMSGQVSSNGFFASGTQRQYPYEILGEKPQAFSQLVNTLFYAGAPSGDMSALFCSEAFAVSNYRPLQAVADLFSGMPVNVSTRSRQQEHDPDGTEKIHYYQNYRGRNFVLASNLSPWRSYYHYLTVIAMVQSMRDVTSHAVAIGYNPATTEYDLAHATTDFSIRGFGHDNVSIFTLGGTRPSCDPVAPGPDCDPPQQPPRLYLSSDFGCEVAANKKWLFCTDGADSLDPSATWIAWGTSEGNVARDYSVDAAGLGYVNAGRFFRSTFVPSDPADLSGETTVLEVADRSLYPSYEAFKDDVLGRNPAFDGTTYTTRAGDSIEYLRDGGTYHNRVNGVEVVLDATSYPRAEMPGLDDFVLTSAGREVVFDHASGALLGDTARVASGVVFGSGGASPPPPPPPPAPTPLTVSGASPAAVAVETGASVTFSVAASGGATPYEYQWMRSPVSPTLGFSVLPEEGAYSGVYSDTLQVNPVAGKHGGWYTCRVKDASGAQVDSAVSQLSVSGETIIGESGLVEFAGIVPLFVPFSRTYENPVVFAMLLTGGDEEANIAARVTEVTQTGFRYRDEVAPGEEPLEFNPALSWVVLEAGSWALDDGRRLDVGTTATAATIGQSLTGRWERVALFEQMSTAPVVVAQTQSDDDPSWVHTRVRNKTTSGFDVALEQEDAAAADHGEEVVGWLAIEPGAGTWAGRNYQAGSTGENVGSQWHEITFAQGLGLHPRIVAGVASVNDPDSVVLRARNLGSSGVEVKLQEDTTADLSVSHYPFDSVDYLVLYASIDKVAEPFLTGLLWSEDGASEEPPAPEPPAPPQPGEDDVIVVLAGEPRPVLNAAVLANDPQASAIAGVSSWATVLLPENSVAGSITGSRLNGGYSEQVWVYTPAPGFLGVDEIDYVVLDDDQAIGVATATFQVVAAPPSVPYASADLFVTHKDVPLLLGLAGLLKNDVGTDLTVSLQAISDASHGSVDVLYEHWGTIRYTPNPGFVGVDSFSYRAVDPGGSTSDATVHIIVADSQEDLAPKPELYLRCGGWRCSYSGLGSWDEAMVETFSWQFGDGRSSDRPMAYHDFYTPGVYHVKLETTDLGGNTVTDLLAVNIALAAEGDPAPIVDFAAECFGQTCTFDARRTADNDTELVLAWDFGDATLGSVSTYRTAEHTFAVAEASYTVTLQARDTAGNLSEGTLSVFVSNRPVARDDWVGTKEDTAITIDVLANDADPDGDPIRVSTIAIPPAHGSVELSQDGGVRYVPDENWWGTDTFEYLLTDDDEGESSQAGTVTVEVYSINDLPALQDDFVEGFADTQVDIPVLANDSDPDGDNLRVHRVGGAGHGTVEIIAPYYDEVRYTPDPGFTGEDSFWYTVDDGSLATPHTMNGYGPATVHVTIPLDNAPPVAHDDAFTGTEDLNLSIMFVQIVGNDDDPDGDELRIIDFTQPEHGVLSEGAISLSFDPDPNWAGLTWFNYTVSDGNGGTDQGKVTITMAPVNDCPVAGDDGPYTVVSSTVLTLAEAELLANDTDVESGSQTLDVVAVGGATSGSVVLSGDVISYTPATAFDGDAQFSYTVQDSAGGSDTGVVHVTVVPDARPVARFTFSCNGPRTCAFDGSSSTDDVGIIRYHWDFGEVLGSALVASPTYTYRNPGTYKVELEVTDTGNQVHRTFKNVTIVEPPPVAVDDSLRVNKYNANTYIPHSTLLGNDSDPNDDLFSIEGTDTSGLWGSLDCGDDACTYTIPYIGWSGVTSFAYTIVDEHGASDTATVTLDVR